MSSRTLAVLVAGIFGFSAAALAADPPAKQGWSFGKDQFNARCAPLCGRYISLHWLGWGFARTPAPIIGGYLNDTIAPQATRISGLLSGLTSTLGLFFLGRASSAEPGLQTGD